MNGRSFESKKAAYDDFKRALREAKAKAAAPAVVSFDASRLPLADYCNRVLQNEYETRVRESKLAKRSWELYAGIVANYLDRSALGETPIEEVEPADIEAWWRSLALGDASRLRYLGFLSGVFEVARKAKHVPLNPVRDAEKPRVDPDDVDFTIYTQEQSEEILGYLRAWEVRQDARWTDERKTERPEHERGRLVLAALLGLHGFGPAEMCGLKKADLVAGGFLPRRQGQRGKVIERLKTKRRRGWVPLDDELLAIVEALPDGFVLPANPERSKPVGDNNLRRSFRWALRGTPYADLAPYDLRHTFAMRLLEEKTDVQTAAELMRNTTEVFLRRYVRSREDLKRDAVRRARGGTKPRPTQGDDPNEADAA